MKLSVLKHILSVAKTWEEYNHMVSALKDPAEEVEVFELWERVK